MTALQETCENDQAMRGHLEAHRFTRPVGPRSACVIRTGLERPVDDGKDGGKGQRPWREKLTAHLLRRDVHHDPDDTACSCGQAMQRSGDDMAER